MATQVAKPNSEIKLIENQSNLQFPVNYTGDKGLSLLLANFITSFGAVEYLTTTQFLNGQFPDAPEGYTQTPCVLPGAIQQNILSGNDTITTVKFIDTYVIGSSSDMMSNDFDLGLYLGNFIVNGENIPASVIGRVVNIYIIKNSNVGVRSFIGSIGSGAYVDAMFRGTSMGSIKLRYSYSNTLDVISVNDGYDLFSNLSWLKTVAKAPLAAVINEIYDLAFAGGAGPAGGALTGNYPNPQLGVEVVNTANLANGAVGTERIANDAVTADKIRAGAVNVDKIADRAIIGVKIALGTIGQSELADGAVTTNKIENGTVSESKLINSSVTVDKIAAGAVTESKLASFAVTTGKIARGVVGMDEITDGAIISSKLASKSVTTGAVVDESITLVKLDGTVKTSIAIGYFGGHFDMRTGSIVSLFSTMRHQVTYSVGLSNNRMNTLTITFDNSSDYVLLRNIQVTPQVHAYDGLTVSTKIVPLSDGKSLDIHVLTISPQGNEVAFQGSIFVLFFLANLN